jgi:hypothetical protein
MKLIGPDRYKLTITDRSASVRAIDGTPHFVKPATAKKKLKLYVVSKDGELLYVGFTTQPMSARLRGGLRADGLHGYHGYSWGRKNSNVLLQIWYLAGDATTLADLETIEAEVVFLFRLQSGQWPSGQTEIHFHQSTVLHRECANRIVEALGKRNCKPSGGG